tara:strand:+ start:576 stop:983 length:408 start_codon:yes stop_codon:yes gene_type:complete
MKILNRTVYERVDGKNLHIFVGTEITSEFKKQNPKLVKRWKTDGFIDTIEDTPTEKTEAAEKAAVKPDKVVTVDDVPTDFDDLKDFDGITVPEAKKVAPTLSLDLAEEFLGLEEAGQNRTGVKAALQKQIDALTG